MRQGEARKEAPKGRGERFHFPLCLKSFELSLEMVPGPEGRELLCKEAKATCL